MTDTPKCAFCGAAIQRGKFLCRDDWFALPASFRTQVNKTWRTFKASMGKPAAEKLPLIGAYRAATNAALEHLREKR